MPRDGSGNFSITGDPLVDGAIAEATGSTTAMQPKLDDIADGLTDSVARNGEAPATANWPMAGFKLTGLAAGSSNGDSVRYEQVIGVFQPLDATLTAFAAVAWSAGNQFPYFTAADTFSLGTITADALLLLADADVPRLGTDNIFTNATRAILLSSTFPNLEWTETDAAADNQRWRFVANGGVFAIQALTDAGASAFPAAYAIRVSRSADTITEVEFNATTIDANAHLDLDNAGLPARLTNTTDAAQNQGLIIESDRATPTAFDQVYISYVLSDSAGNQDEFGRISTQGTDVTSGSEDARIVFSMIVAGALTAGWIMNVASLTPSANDGGSIGASGVGVSDYFGASGHVFNLGAGDVLITHSTNALAFTGASSGYSFDAAVTISSAAVKTAGKQTVPVVAGAMTPRTTNGAALATTEHATNDVMIVTLDFDQTTSEGAQFVLPMPKSWNESTVTFQPIWTAAAGTAAQTVIWSMSGLALSDDDAIDQAFGTPQTSSDALIATGDVHIGPESSAITIAGTPAEGDLVIFQITRDVSDTLAADARLIAIRLHFTDNAATDA